MDWDDTDTISGLTIGYEAASAIIETCDYNELRLFNAPRLANPHISTGEQVELFQKAMAEAKKEGREQGQLREIAAGDAKRGQQTKRCEPKETQRMTCKEEKQKLSIRISRAMKDFLRKRSLRHSSGVAEQDLCPRE